jgi:hypothetical protein
VWAIDAARGKEKNKGIYFIDKNGIPFSGNVDTIQVVRSGKRNMPSTPVGSVTSLQNPLKTVSGITRFVFDSTTQVVTAGAAGFKDFWRVDSSLYRKDTVFIVGKLANKDSSNFFPEDYYTMDNQRRYGRDIAWNSEYPSANFRAYAQDNGGGGGTDHQHKSWMLFNFEDPNKSIIPANSVITNAQLYLLNDSNLNKYYNLPPHQNLRNSNESYLRRTIGPWAANYREENNWAKPYFFHEEGPGITDIGTQALIPATTHGIDMVRNDTVTVTGMVQGMLDDYYASNGSIVASMMMALVDPTGGPYGEGWNSQLVYSNIRYLNKPSFLDPKLYVTYCKPCASGLKPIYGSTPVAGYYCYSEPQDSFICKPNIVDSAINPYRWGVLGTGAWTGRILTTTAVSRTIPQCSPI